MAFVPLPVAVQAEDQWRAVRHEGYSLMDQFLTSNEREPKAVDAFLVFLLDTVGKNILEHPDDEKYRRLKKRSKALAIVNSVKLGSKLLDYLGFRGKIEDFEEFLVLRTADATWLEEFREKIDLIRLQWSKKKQTVVLEAKTASERDLQNAQYKAMLLNRIEEERKERGTK